MLVARTNYDFVDVSGLVQEAEEVDGEASGEDDEQELEDEEGDGVVEDALAVPDAVHRDHRRRVAHEGGRRLVPPAFV